MANFLSYVNNHLYDDSIFHRSVPGFVTQGGGYGIGPATQNNPEQSHPAERAWFKMSRTGETMRGTVALAKVPAQTNTDGSVVAGTGPRQRNQRILLSIWPTLHRTWTKPALAGSPSLRNVVDGTMGVVDQIAKLPTFNVTSSHFGWIFRWRISNPANQIQSSKSHRDQHCQRRAAAGHKRRQRK